MNTILTFPRMGEYFLKRRTSSPISSKLTMLLRHPHGPLLIGGLLADSPFAWSQISPVQLTTCASPAQTCMILSAQAPPVPPAYQDLYKTLSTQIASSMRW